MKVSIITVVYNNAKTIADAIESVLHQDYPHIEYIVIDGMSSDGTIEIIKSYGDKIDVFVSEKDKGLYDAINKGIKLATGDVVGLINSDDALYSTDCVSAIVRQFQKTEAEIVYGDKVYYNEDLSEIRRYWKSGNLDLRKYKKGWMPPCLSTYIKRSVYNKYGLFRDDLKIAADYELLFRFIYVNRVKTVYLPKVIAKMREGGVSNASFKNILKSNLEVYKSWQLNGLRVSPLIIILKPLSKLLQKV